MTRPYAQNSIVYACVRVNARAAMGTPWDLFTSAEDDAAPAPESDPLRALLKKPNPIMSGRTMWGLVSIFYQLAGGCYLFMNGARSAERTGKRMLGPLSPGEMPAEIWPVRDDLVEPVLDEDTKLPKAYVYRAGSKPIEYPAHAVAHIYEPDPYAPLKGYGPAQAAWRGADHMFRAEAFDDALVENGGQIGGVFSHEDKNIRQPQLEAMKTAIAQNAEKPRNDRKNVILPAGMKYTPTAMTPADMQAKDMRTLKRDEILAVFGVPKTLLGYTDDVNRANSKEVRRSYYENTVSPYIEWLEDALVANFIPLLPRKYATWVLGFAIEKTPAMREDLDSQIKRVSELMGCGVTFSEAAEIVGLEHSIEDNGRRFIASGLRPIDEMPADPNAASDASADAAPTPKPPAKAEKIANDGRARREAALDEEEKRLAPHDIRFKKAVRRVFDSYILAQIKRLREIASGSVIPVPVLTSIHPWDWYTESGSWNAHTMAYARLMDMVPPTGDEGWVVVRGITEQELTALVLGNEARWGAQLWDALSGPYKGAVEEAAKAAQKIVGGALINATDPDVVEFMRAKQVRIVEGPMSVVAERVKRAIVEGMATAGETGTLAERVRAALESVEDSLRALQDQLGTRAAMIARTESAAASSAARTAQFSEAGIDSHEWASAGDDLVRSLHTIDGEVRRVGERFSNGLRHPGDPEGTAGNVINCRCTTLPVI